jgi:hypothetical protein
MWSLLLFHGTHTVVVDGFSSLALVSGWLYDRRDRQLTFSVFYDLPSPLLILAVPLLLPLPRRRPPLCGIFLSFLMCEPDRLCPEVEGVVVQRPRVEHKGIAVRGGVGRVRCVFGEHGKDSRVIG